jgi:ABC-type multidrug transport system fused ATPase/permease subunit
MAKDKNSSNESLRQYVWNYFQVHAAQRLTTFNFYILISTLIATGFLIVISGMPILALLLSVILMVLSLVFWKLDVRNKQLVRTAEAGLKYLEGKDEIADKTSEPHILNVFRYEEAQTNKLRAEKVKWIWNRVFTYSTCFNIVFVVFAVLGLFGVIFSIINICQMY